MTNSLEPGSRILSGMRPTGRLHLGHYHGVLKNWINLQHEHECFFFVADWHALTTHYEDPALLQKHIREMVVDWLAAGVDPGRACLFVQSQVPEHAELHLLLSMMTPVGWLERVPSYKDQQQKLSEKDLSTYGFLGYPLLQSADILLYKADAVPVGEDQVAHVELTREVARRFNFLYGREPGFEVKAEAAADKMGKRNAKLYRNQRKAWQEKGDEDALQIAQALVDNQQNLTIADKDRLLGYLEGGGRIILVEPEAALTEAAKLPGLDGQKMSKSYGNTISLRDTPKEVEQKVKRMPTDPARVRRDDPGTPEKCPVWDLHQIYSDAGTKDWVQDGCKTAGIGCVDCKGPVIASIEKELAPMRQRAKEFDASPDLVQSIIEEGNERAREAARDTLRDVRSVMGLV